MFADEIKNESDDEDYQDEENEFKIRKNNRRFITNRFRSEVELNQDNYENEDGFNDAAKKKHQNIYKYQVGPSSTSINQIYHPPNGPPPVHIPTTTFRAYKTYNKHKAHKDKGPPQFQRPTHALNSTYKLRKPTQHGFKDPSFKQRSINDNGIDKSIQGINGNDKGKSNHSNARGSKLIPVGRDYDNKKRMERNKQRFSHPNLGSKGKNGKNDPRKKKCSQYACCNSFTTNPNKHLINEEIYHDHNDNEDDVYSDANDYISNKTIDINEINNYKQIHGIELVDLTSNASKALEHENKLVYKDNDNTSDDKTTYNNNIYKQIGCNSDISMYASDKNEDIARNGDEHGDEQNGDEPNDKNNDNEDIARNGDESGDNNDDDTSFTDPDNEGGKSVISGINRKDVTDAPSYGAYLESKNKQRMNDNNNNNNNECSSESISEQNMITATTKGGEIKSNKEALTQMEKFGNILNENGNDNYENNDLKEEEVNEFDDINDLTELNELNKINNENLNENNNNIKGINNEGDIKDRKNDINIDKQLLVEKCRLLQHQLDDAIHEGNEKIKYLSDQKSELSKELNLIKNELEHIRSNASFDKKKFMENIERFGKCLNRQISINNELNEAIKIEIKSSCESKNTITVLKVKNQSKKEKIILLNGIIDLNNEKINEMKNEIRNINLEVGILANTRQELLATAHECKINNNAIFNEEDEVRREVESLIHELELEVKYTRDSQEKDRKKHQKQVKLLQEEKEKVEDDLNQQIKALNNKILSLNNSIRMRSINRIRDQNDQRYQRVLFSKILRTLLPEKYHDVVKGLASEMDASNVLSSLCEMIIHLKIEED